MYRFLVSFAETGVELRKLPVQFSILTHPCVHELDLLLSNCLDLLQELFSQLTGLLLLRSLLFLLRIAGLRWLIVPDVFDLGPIPLVCCLLVVHDFVQGPLTLYL